jgi:hypothetical protein
MGVGVQAAGILLVFSPKTALKEAFDFSIMRQLELIMRNGKARSFCCAVAEKHSEAHFPRNRFEWI